MYDNFGELLLTDNITIIREIHNVILDSYSKEYDYYLKESLKLAVRHGNMEIVEFYAHSPLISAHTLACVHYISMISHQKKITEFLRSIPRVQAVLRKRI